MDRVAAERENNFIARTGFQGRLTIGMQIYFCMPIAFFYTGITIEREGEGKEMKNMKAAEQTARGRGVYQGMNWITQKKRLAIYLRDGLACAYCGASVETGAQLSLDHLIPHSEGGTNHESNLVTCCSRCNSSRGARP